MREAFHGALIALGEELAGMCESATTAMRRATQALLTADHELAEEVLSADDRLDAARDRCERHAYNLIALQAPVARDLRVILAAIYCADKVERMGDLAAHVADIARRNHPEPAVPAELSELFARLGARCVAMSEQLTKLTTGVNRTGFTELDQADAEVDSVHSRVLDLVTDESWPHGIRAARDLALLARFYERFADQAVSVARRLDFAATGILPGRIAAKQARPPRSA
ncbi:MAG: phosphate signaling complex protein PhoU [Haloechinothrix sp.]